MKLYSIRAYAAQIGVNRSTLTRWVKSGKLPPGAASWVDDLGKFWIVEKESEPCQESNQPTTDG